MNSCRTENGDMSGQQSFPSGRRSAKGLSPLFARSPKRRHRDSRLEVHVSGAEGPRPPEEMPEELTSRVSPFAQRPFSPMRLGGFEPPTVGLEVRCSSAELQARSGKRSVLRR